MNKQFHDRPFTVDHDLIAMGGFDSDTKIDSSDASPPPSKQSRQPKSQQCNSASDGQAEKVNELPKRRSYDISLPGFLVKALLEKNNVQVPMKELQLKIIVRDKK
jgi:hypothetical protein